MAGDLRLHSSQMTPVSTAAFESLRRLDTCTVSNANERFDVRLGFVSGAVGCITNGTVRDLGAVESLNFPLFSGRVSVSHAYAHVIEFGNPVEIGGLLFQPGDLVHGNRKGEHVIPREIAEYVPDMARRIREQKKDLVQFCRSGASSREQLSDRMQTVSRDALAHIPGLKP